MVPPLPSRRVAPDGAGASWNGNAGPRVEIVTTLDHRASVGADGPRVAVRAPETARGDRDLRTRARRLMRRRVPDA